MNESDNSHEVGHQDPIINGIITNNEMMCMTADNSITELPTNHAPIE